MSKPQSLIEILKGCIHDTTQRFNIQKECQIYANYKSPYMDLSKHQGVGTSVWMRQSNEFDLIKKTRMNLVYPIGNEVPMLQSLKI